MEIHRLEDSVLSIFHKMMYKFNAIIIKSQFFQVLKIEIGKLILKLIWKHKGPRISKTILKRKNIIRQLALSDFRTYYKATLIKTVWYCQKFGKLNQWNRTDSYKMDPNLYVSLIFNQCVKTIQWGKKSIFNKWWWNYGYRYGEKTA